MTSTRNRQRTYARNRAISRRGYPLPTETDGQFLLKLVIIILLGTFWLKFAQPIVIAGVPLIGFPAGLFLGLLFVGRFEKLQSDRKIWYAALIIVTIISYFVPAGIVL